MSEITSRLIFNLLLLVSTTATAQVSTAVNIVDDGEGNAVLVRTSTYTEPMPDTSYITARRAEINRQIVGLVAERTKLDTMRGQWEEIYKVEGEGRFTIALPPAPIKIPPSVTIGQGTSTGVLFAVSDTNGPLLEVLLDNRNRIIINGQRWAYDRAKKTWTIKK